MTVPTRSADAIEQMLREMEYEFDGFTMNPVSGRCTFTKGTMNYPGQVMETTLPGNKLDVRDAYGNTLRPADLSKAFERMSRM